MNKFETLTLGTDRLILKKGTSKDCIKVYEYDLLKCRGIGEEDIIVKSDKAIDFIGNDPELYYKECINDKRYAWLAEGLATTISYQYDNSLFVFNASLDEMINGTKDYKNYHTMFKYVLDTYGRDYILELIRDYDLLVRDTPRLYEEVKDLYYSDDYSRGM